MSLLLDQASGAHELRLKLKAAIENAVDVVSNSTSTDLVKKELGILAELINPISAAPSEALPTPSLSSTYPAKELLLLQTLFRDDGHAKTVLSLIFAKVLLLWSAAFSETECVTLIHCWVFNSPPIDTLHALSETLASLHVGASDNETSTTSSATASSSRIEHCQQLSRLILLFLGLTPSINTPGAIRMLNDICARASQPQQPHLWTQIVGLIAAIPDKIFNILKRETNVRFRKEEYFGGLSTIFAKWLEKLSVSVRFPFFAIWTTKVESNGQLDTLVNAVDPVSFCKASPDASKVLSNVFLHLPSTIIEKALVALLKNKKVSHDRKLSALLVALLQDLVETSSTARFVLTQKLFLVYSFPWWVLRQVVQFLYEVSKKKKSEWWLDAVTSLARNAGDAKFVKNASYEQQRRLNRTLIFIFDQAMVMRSDIEETELLLALMASVQELLNQPTEKLAVLGMQLGEAFSKIIDPSNPLKFDAVVPEAWDEPDLAPEWTDTTPVDLNQIEVDFSFDDTQLGLSSDYFDPSMTFMDYVNYFHPGSTPFDSKKGAEARHRFRKGKFVQVDLDDDLSDTTEFKTPLYLRDCITSLRSEDPNVLEATLKILAPLISSRPDDLSELAVSVCTTLLHVNNNYELEDFDKQKLDALVALVTYEPTRTIPYIVKTFYEPNFSLHERYVMLDALSGGSQKLSEHTVDPRPEYNPVALKALTFSKAAPSATTPKVLISEHSSSTNAHANPAGKSRRWGTERKAVQTFQNRLAPHIDALFRLLEYKEHPKGLYLLMSDPRLLGKLIYAISVFIECAGPSTKDFEAVGRKLLELVWKMRYHEDPFVRRALLLAIGAFLKTAPAWVLFEALTSEMNEVVAWLEENGKDADEEVRTLSIIATMQLSAHYKDNPQYQPFQAL